MKRMLVLVLVLLSVSTGASANESLFRNSQVGFDFNIPIAYAAAKAGRHYFAGTLTYGKKNTHWELATPFFFNRFSANTEVCCEIHLKRVDLQLRRYFRKSQHGPYIGVVARYSDVLGRDENNINQRVSFSRTGVGAVVGLKTFLFKSRVYWNTNFHYGYFVNDAPLLASDIGIFPPSEFSSSKFFNLELLKIGFRF